MFEGGMITVVVNVMVINMFYGFVWKCIIYCICSNPPFISSAVVAIGLIVSTIRNCMVMLYQFLLEFDVIIGIKRIPIIISGIISIVVSVCSVSVGFCIVNNWSVVIAVVILLVVVLVIIIVGVTVGVSVGVIIIIIIGIGVVTIVVTVVVMVFFPFILVTIAISVRLGVVTLVLQSLLQLVNFAM